MPTKHGVFDLVAFRQKNTGEQHIALIKGTWEEDEPVLTRVHSSCFTGDILHSCVAIAANNCRPLWKW